jgi:hypothetical protein
VVLEKDGEDQLDWSCEKWRSVTYSQLAEFILHEIRKLNAKWISHILRRNCLLKQDIEGKIKGKMEATVRRGIRRRMLLNDLTDKRVYSHLKDKTLDHTICRNRFGGSFGPVVRQITEWMNTDILSSPRYFTHLIFYSQVSRKIPDITTQRKSDYLLSKSTW